MIYLAWYPLFLAVLFLALLSVVQICSITVFWKLI